MLYQLSYEATHWERGQLIEFISSREEWNDVKYMYEIIHIWTAVVDESEEWSQPQFRYELFHIYFTRINILNSDAAKEKER